MKEWQGIEHMEKPKATKCIAITNLVDANLKRKDND